MMPRLRLPAYGKQLLNERRLGRHPLVVHVIYGEDWRAGERCDCCDGDDPPARIAVRPSEFAPGVYDWHCVTGCYVAVFDREGALDLRDEKFLALAGEIGRFSGPLWVLRPDVAHSFPICVHAAALREKHGDWPAWWPAETERVNGERRKRWIEVYFDHLQARPARAA